MGRYGQDDWDSLYKTGISDAHTLYGNDSPRSVAAAHLHYASVEQLIYRHLMDRGVKVRGPVLDIGSGAGHWLEFWHSLGAEKVDGLDCSILAVNHIRARFARAENVSCRQGQAQTLVREWGPRAYNLISAVSVMYHICDDAEWEAVIGQIGALLRPGGMFIATGHFGCLDGLDVGVDRWGCVYKRLRSKRRWARTLSAAGFADLRLYRNRIYLWADKSLPHNSVMIGTRA